VTTEGDNTVLYTSHLGYRFTAFVAES
jgi:hypothetical protein